MANHKTGKGKAIARGVKAGIKLYTGRPVLSVQVFEDRNAVDCRAWAIRAKVRGLGTLDLLVVNRDDTPIEEMPADHLEDLFQEGRWATWPPASR